MSASKDYIYQHEEIRKQLWIRAWVNTANANDCKSTESATKWADAALADFDERFPPPEITNDKKDIQ